MHCASLLRTIFASLACTNERVHVHNERNFPQAKLDSEINVPFLLDEHGDLYFLSHNDSVHIILFNRKKNKKIIGQNKRYSWKRAKIRYSGMQIMTAKNTTIRMLYVYAILNSVIFRKIPYDLFHMLDTIPVKFFLMSVSILAYGFYAENLNSQIRIQQAGKTWLSSLQCKLTGKASNFSHWRLH